jgi:cellulose synthase operon protein YhjQ
MGQRSSDPQLHAARLSDAESATSSSFATGGQWPPSSGDRLQDEGPSHDSTREISSNPSANRPPAQRPLISSRVTQSAAAPRPVSPFSQALVPSDSTRGRRAQDDFDYQQSQGFPERRTQSDAASEPSPLPTQRPANPADPTGPAWLYAPPAPQVSPKPITQLSPVQSSVADTLQHSRERVAARWYALKGVFEQPGQEQTEAAPIRQKETRTPVLAVFSLAGGVGKTSLVATVGRALSSMGEKVLLTDTTSHGLLPFYFGASELRQGTVRTFSPPSGSTDAPIYLVSYDIDQKGSDDAAQEELAEEIINNSRGTHRILLDLNVSSSWIVRRMSRLNPTILVPVAPDMNSVISLQTLDKFFSGVNDGDGRPLQPYYVLNQFDTSLPLHLDVREVMRRQLGDRLLPFVIRRAPAVSEALAEGMTVVDYAPDSPVAEDYLNLATWLRTVAAPATAGFRNVRWSER